MSIAAISVLFFSTVILLFLLIREKKLLERILRDISDRVVSENSYPQKIDSLLELYKQRNKFRNESYAEAQISANESERSASRLARNIQKALIYSSKISKEAGNNRVVSSTLFQNVSEGSAAVEEINASIRSLKEQVIIQDGAVKNTSSSIEEINGSLKGVSDLISCRKAEAEDLVSITAEGSDMVHKSAEVMLSVQDKVNNALSLITVIDAIASQTNLLSMNAAIEAAHAGESGKGFAVVADEIRKLAESTASNAKNISVTLRDLVNNIESAGNLSRESEQAFSNIAAGVKNVSETFSQINDNTEAIFNNTQKVVQSTLSLKDISATTTLSMEEMEIGAGEIAAILTQSKDISEDLDLSMQELSRNSKDINLISTRISDAYIKSNRAFNQMVDKILSNQKGTAQTSSRIKMNTIVLSHVNWVAMTRALIDGTVQSEDMKTINPASCALGRWLSESGSKEIKDSGKLHTLIKHHEEIHKKAAKIIEQIKADKRGELENLFEEIQNGSNRIIEIITTLGYNEGITWDESISVKIDLFDTHHKKLIDLINQLYKAMEKGDGNNVLIPIIDELVEYTVYHFSAEEKVFKKYNYPDTARHIEQHRGFVKKAQDLQRDVKKGSAVLTNDVLDFLQDWVINHIMKVDFHYSGFLKDKEI
jgi:methyl-accepting chemotaxis protein